MDPEEIGNAFQCAESPDLAIEAHKRISVSQIVFSSQIAVTPLVLRSKSNYFLRVQSLYPAGAPPRYLTFLSVDQPKPEPAQIS